MLSARANATPIRRCPRTSGLPNKRSVVSGSTRADCRFENCSSAVSPSIRIAVEAEGPSERMCGIGKPRIARKCKANSDKSCEINVTIPVSCGRGDTSLNHTSSPLTKSSTPNSPRPPNLLVMRSAMSRLRSSAVALIGCGCHDSR